VLSVVEGHLTLTYQSGDECGNGRQRKTIVTMLCDEHAVVIRFCLLYMNFSTHSINELYVGKCMGKCMGK